MLELLLVSRWINMFTVLAMDHKWKRCSELKDSSDVMWSADPFLNHLSFATIKNEKIWGHPRVYVFTTGLDLPVQPSGPV